MRLQLTSNLKSKYRGPWLARFQLAMVPDLTLFKNRAK